MTFCKETYDSWTAGNWINCNGNTSCPQLLPTILHNLLTLNLYYDTRPTSRWQRPKLKRKKIYMYISYYKAFPPRLKGIPGIQAFFTLQHGELHCVNILSFPPTLPAHPLKTRVACPYRKSFPEEKNKGWKLGGAMEEDKPAQKRGKPSNYNQCKYCCHI